MTQEKLTSLSGLCFSIFEMGIPDPPGGDCSSAVHGAHLRRLNLCVCVGGVVSLPSRRRHERVSLHDLGGLDSDPSFVIDKGAT